MATTQDTYNLAVGQAMKLVFPVPFADVFITADVIATRIVTDQVLTLNGTSEGEAILTVNDARGKEVYSATVIVGAERGHTVRLYDSKSKDYLGFYCTNTACGRADKELNGAREVSSSTTVVGGVARTVTYGK